jgi:hypothetical protein
MLESTCYLATIFSEIGMIKDKFQVAISTTNRKALDVYVLAVKLYIVQQLLRSHTTNKAHF